jgi:cyclophilin family peptidyl-prolyl cis-trans isomerase
MFFARIKSSRILFVLILLLAFSSASCGKYIARNELNRVDCLSEIILRVDQSRIGEDHFFEANLLSSKYPEVRRWCAVALGEIGSPSALPLLYKAIKTGEAEIRALSAFAIGEIEDRDRLAKNGMAPDPQAIPEITKRLDDSSAAVRIRAIEALGKIGSEAEADAIIKRAERFNCDDAADSAAIKYSITALGRLKSTKSFDLLLKWANMTKWTADDSSENNKGRIPGALSRITSAAREQHQEPSPASSAHWMQENRPMAIAPRSYLTPTAARTIAFNRLTDTIARVETNRGVFEIELSRDDAPVTSENFANAAEYGAFNKAAFEQDSGMVIERENSEPRLSIAFSPAHEINPQPFVRGSVGFTLEEGRPSRLFIALTPQPYLDGVHVCFGRVISGIQIVEKLSADDQIKRIVVRKKTALLDKIRY